MDPGSKWRPLVDHYDACLRQYGAKPQGVDWPNGRDLALRFSVALNILSSVPRGRTPVLLDLGCGPGLLVDYLRAAGRLDQIVYRGIDLSSSMVEAARERHPDQQFEVRNIVDHPLPDGAADIVIMNGLLTERVSIDRASMVGLAQGVVTASFKVANVGIAFNVMNQHVDWQRDDLFHWSFDEIAAFLKANVTRHYAFRADYGLYEFMTFAWHSAQQPDQIEKEEWW